MLICPLLLALPTASTAMADPATEHVIAPQLPSER
jgi:hypothetical protein